MRKIISICICCALVLGCSSVVSVRETLDFNDDWMFHLGDIPEAYDPSFDDSGWRQLELPHDWAIEGDFSPENPSGVGGGALPGGVGWYRKTFFAPAQDSCKLWRLEFDGIYMNSEVFVNGVSLGVRPYGYISFGYDISQLLEWDAENAVAVRVDNAEQPNSRWYSGCGIYRNVRLVKTGKVRVAPYGIFVEPGMTYLPKASGDGAELHEGFFFVQTEVLSDDPEVTEVVLRQTVLDAAGKVAGKVEDTYKLADLAGQEQMVRISKPHLWDVDDSYLYTLVTEIATPEGAILDRVETKTGLRHFFFSPEEGFSLNDKPLKINGVCMHHDLGCLGAAVNKNAIRRQLEILKEMGCNAIRTSHNPPAPELLDLCDEMGFIVQDEAFDMWRKKKTAHDYSRYFNQWHEKDLRDFIIRDRNHPSVMMWSIGNEVLEQWSHADADTLTLAEANFILNFGQSSDMLASADDAQTINSLLTAKLAGIVRSLDESRPVTAGCNEPSPWNHLFHSGALDIIGYNYHNQNIASVPTNFPGKPFIISESNSALMTRGYYRMPSDTMFIWPVRWDIPFYEESFACSSYENCHVPWGNTHEETLKLVRDNDFVSGQFVWTGFDYIGEPTPYGWPARSSFFGIVDLAGFPKDVYHLYRSEWTDEPVLHLFPHWNWTEGQEIDMWCYYNGADEVELFVNGRSQGVKAKTEDCLHTVWRTVYEPGYVKVVARKDGREVASQTIRTAGEPAQIRLSARKYGDGVADDALAYVTVEILDAQGNLCPHADNLVQFEVTSGAEIVGTDNGNPVSLERFKSDRRKAFNGKCLVVLEAAEKGRTKLTATSDGLKHASVSIEFEK